MKKFISVIIICSCVLFSSCARQTSSLLQATPSFSPSASPLEESEFTPLISSLPTNEPTLVNTPANTPSDKPESKPASTPKPTDTQSKKPDAQQRIVSLASAAYGYEQMMADIPELMQAYPDLLTLSSIGKSEFGRDIPLIILGNPNAEKKVLIVATTHAREYSNTLLAMSMIERYCNSIDSAFYKNASFRKLAESCALYFVPLHNPDGAELCIKGILSVPDEYKAQVEEIYARSVKKGYLTQGSYSKWKANGLGIDLNQNYGYGTKPYSKRETEPMSENNGGGKEGFNTAETKAVAELCEKEHFQMLTALHSCGQLIYWGFGASGQFKQHCKEIASAFKVYNGYSLIIGAPTPQYHCHLGLKDWFMVKYSLPGFTIETGSVAAPLPLYEIKKVIDKNIMIPAIMAYFA